MNRKKLYAGYLMNETAASRAAKAVLTGADGVFLLDRSADDAYERGYRAYTALYPALKDVFAFYGRPL